MFLYFSVSSLLYLHRLLLQNSTMHLTDQHDQHLLLLFYRSLSHVSSSITLQFFILSLPCIIDNIINLTFKPPLLYDYDEMVPLLLIIWVCNSQVMLLTQSRHFFSFMVSHSKIETFHHILKTINCWSNMAVHYYLPPSKDPPEGHHECYLIVSWETPLFFFRPTLFWKD